MHVMWINEVADLTGGCEYYLLSMAKLLKQQGVTNTLLYGVDGWTEPELLKAFDYAFPLVTASRQIKEINPDIIYIHRLEGTMVMQSIINTGKPVVRFFHDHKLFCLREHKYTVLRKKTCKKPIGLRCYPCLGFINPKASFPYLRLTSLVTFKREHKINKRLNTIITASQYMKDHLVAHRFDPNVIQVNPLFYSGSGDYEKRDRENILFAGQLVRGKGVDILLKAFSLVKTDQKLIICGEGKQGAELKLQAEKLGLNDRVIWKGKISKKELDHLYSKVLFVVIPSRVPETFGLSGPEAMSKGAPVIASDVGGVREWLIDGKTGFAVPPNNPKILAKTITKLLLDDHLREFFGEEGARISKEMFQPELHVRRLMKTFSDLLQ